MFWNYVQDPAALVYTVLACIWYILILPTALGFIAERYKRPFLAYWVGLTLLLSLGSVGFFLLGFQDTVSAMITVSVVFLTAFAWGVIVAAVPRAEV